MVDWQNTINKLKYTVCSLSNFGVGVVLRTEFDGVKVGDHVYYMGMREYLNFSVRPEARFTHYYASASFPEVRYTPKPRTRPCSQE